MCLWGRLTGGGAVAYSLPRRILFCYCHQTVFVSEFESAVNAGKSNKMVIVAGIYGGVPLQGCFWESSLRNEEAQHIATFPFSLASNRVTGAWFSGHFFLLLLILNNHSGVLTIKLDFLLMFCLLKSQQIAHLAASHLGIVCVPGASFL